MSIITSACWVIFHAFVVVRLFFFFKFLQEHYQILSSSLDPEYLNGYQQMTKVACSKERVEHVARRELNISTIIIIFRMQNIAPDQPFKKSFF